MGEFNKKFEVDPYSAKHVVDAYKARLNDIRPPLNEVVVKAEVFSATRNALREYASEEYKRQMPEK